MKRNILFISSLLLVFMGATISLINTPVSALSNSGFKPELIITDDVFIDKNSMSASQIQSFLESKNSVCLKNFTTLSLNDSNKDGLGDEPYGKGKGEKVRASTLIYQAAQLYGISPKVILATLQKEQGLITRQDCPSWRYNTALGYGCPDSEPCDSSAYGFTRQIDYGTWHFKGFFYDSYPVPPTVPGKKAVAYNPDGRCGSKTITIANRATAALYSYTPYQPNSYALGGGTNSTYPSCGAFGNLNFWRFFTQWFGSTYGTPFFRIDGGNKVYIDGAGGDTYYHVPNPSVLASYGSGTVFKKSPRNVSSTSMSGRTYAGTLPQIARFEGSQIFVVANGRLIPFTSRTMYEDTYGFTMGEEARLPAGLLYQYRKTSSVQAIVKLSDASPIYSIEAGKSRHISSREAYETLGSPTYASRSSSTFDKSFASSMTIGAPIIAPLKIVQASNTNTWYFWNGATLIPFDTSLSSITTITPDYKTSQVALSLLPISSQKVGRYVKDASGNVFALSKSHKYSLTQQDVSNLAIPSQSIMTVENSFLNRFTTLNPHATFIRIDSNDLVYKTAGTDAYSVFDRYDFQKFGGSFTNVISIPSYLEPMYAKRGYLFSSKRLVQVVGNPKVYIVDSARNMHHILSPEIAKQYGITLNNIAKIASLSNTPAYTVSRDGLTRFVKSTNGSIWLVDSRGRYAITLTQLSDYFGYSSSSFSILSSELLNITPTRVAFSQYARDPATGRVYKIDAGKKYWYSTRAAFDRSGVGWSKVVNYSPEFLATIPNGASIK